MRERYRLQPAAGLRGLDSPQRRALVRVVPSPSPAPPSPQPPATAPRSSDPERVRRPIADGRSGLRARDDAWFRERLIRRLVEAGWEVSPGGRPAPGASNSVAVARSAIVLDVTPPGKSRRRRVARGDEAAPVAMIVTAGNLGELLGYVETVLRGPAAPMPPQRKARRIVLGPLEVDAGAHHVRVQGQEVNLTPIEMRLLTDLVEHAGRVRTREDLLRDVWGYSPNVKSRSPDTHVRRLRKKLGPARNLIQNVRGVGYRLRATRARRRRRASRARKAS